MSWFFRMLHSFDAWLPPKFCLLCEARAEDFLCAQCVKRCRRAPCHCLFCSRRVAQAGAVCGVCLSRPPVIDGLQVGFCFEGAVRELVLMAKFARSRAALEVMMREMARLPLPTVDGVVPLPMALRRLQGRGFNQSLFLARAVAARLDCPIYNEVLFKRWRQPQSLLLGAKERRQNIRGAFGLKKSVSGRVLLVDDVYTTGATLNEAAAVLKCGGASQVFAVVFAAGFQEV